MMELFDIKIPKELIAQEPRERGKSRLMIIKDGNIYHGTFYDIERFLNEGDVIVVNNSKVIPAKLIGRKRTGGKVEILLIKKLDENLWRCFAKGKLKKEEEEIFIKDIKAKLIKRNSEFLIEFDGKIDLYKYGKAPLPPYIKRDVPLEKYQTIFAKIEGSLACPTAGLHFNEEIVEKLKKKGVKFVEITLHVGIPTFKTANSLEEYKRIFERDAEFFEVSEDAARIINEAKDKGKRILAVGTTCVKALESCSKNGKVYSMRGYSSLFIYPGYKFKSPINSILTNFHLPKSSNILLVAAFLGVDLLKKAYEEAIKKRYFFYSFGDAMLILK